MPGFTVVATQALTAGMRVQTPMGMQDVVEIRYLYEQQWDKAYAWYVIVFTKCRMYSIGEYEWDRWNGF